MKTERNSIFALTRSNFETSFKVNFEMNNSSESQSSEEMPVDKSCPYPGPAPDAGSMFSSEGPQQITEDPLWDDIMATLEKQKHSVQQKREEFRKENMCDSTRITGKPCDNNKETLKPCDNTDRITATPETTGDLAMLLNAETQQSKTAEDPLRDDKVETTIEKKSGSVLDINDIIENIRRIENRNRSDASVEDASVEQPDASFEEASFERTLEKLRMDLERIGKEHDVFGKRLERLGKNLDILGTEMKMFGKNQDALGRDLERLKKRLEKIEMIGETNDEIIGETTDVSGNDLERLKKRLKALNAYHDDLAEWWDLVGKRYDKLVTHFELCSKHHDRLQQHWEAHGDCEDLAVLAVLIDGEEVFRESEAIMGQCMESFGKNHDAFCKGLAPFARNQKTLRKNLETFEFELKSTFGQDLERSKNDSSSEAAHHDVSKNDSSSEAAHQDVSKNDSSPTVDDVSMQESSLTDADDKKECEEKYSVGEEKNSADEEKDDAKGESGGDSYEKDESSADDDEKGEHGGNHDDTQDASNIAASSIAVSSSIQKNTGDAEESVSSFKKSFIAVDEASLSAEIAYKSVEEASSQARKLVTPLLEEVSSKGTACDALLTCNALDTASIAAKEASLFANKTSLAVHRASIATEGVSSAGLRASLSVEQAAVADEKAFDVDRKAIHPSLLVQEIASAHAAHSLLTETSATKQQPTLEAEKAAADKAVANEAEKTALTRWHEAIATYEAAVTRQQDAVAKQRKIAAQERMTNAEADATRLEEEADKMQRECFERLQKALQKKAEARKDLQKAMELERDALRWQSQAIQRDRESLRRHVRTSARMARENGLRFFLSCVFFVVVGLFFGYM